MDKVIYERLNQNLERGGFPQLILLNGDHFGEVNPVCPECGSKKYVKNGFHKRCPTIGDFGKITVYVQRYECKRCDKGFSAKIDGIVKKWRQYAEILREKVNSIATIMKCSARKIQQVLLALYGVSPSHQTILNWLGVQIPKFSYSGYYSYDEQVVRINGKKAYRLTLFDAGLNVPVAEEVSYKLSKKRVKRFLKKNLKGHLLYSITTDDRKWYRKIIKKDLKAIHQLCGFHFQKHVTEDADWYFKRKSVSDAEKMRIAVCVSLIREVFRSFTEEEFLEKLEKLYAIKDEFPSRLKKHIEKLVEDVDLYTNYLLDPHIPKTSNHAEGYYRQTDPKKMKKRYKTPQGLVQALYSKAVYWIVRHGFIPEEESLHIARKNLSRQYNKTNIHRVFSKKKKRFLTYWMGDPLQSF